MYLSKIRLVGGPFDGTLRSVPPDSGRQVLLADGGKVRDFDRVNQALRRVGDPYNSARQLTVRSQASVYEHVGVRHKLQVDDFCFAGTFAVSATFSTAGGWQLAVSGTTSLPARRLGLWEAKLATLGDLEARALALLAGVGGPGAQRLRNTVAGVIDDARHAVAAAGRVTADAVAAGELTPEARGVLDRLEQAELTLDGIISDAVDLQLSAFPSHATTRQQRVLVDGR